MTITSRNPATGKVLREYEELGQAELESKLERAAEVSARFRRAEPRSRAECLTRAASLLLERREELGELMTLEMGKALGAAVAEAEKCARVCLYYAENGPRFLADEVVETDARRSWIRFEPLGPVLAIMPWNFPFWQVFRFAAPALMAGNVGLLKHASNVPACSLAIERLLLEAGFPEGAFQALLISAARAEHLVADTRVRAVTLTGSEPAGRAVARRAGEALKKTVLELGGSDPFVVMPGADLASAVRTAVRARIINNGQSCIAAKRFIVHEQVRAEFERGFVAAMTALRVGDPLDPDTDVGPLATEAIREELHDQVEASVRAGARLLLGGEPLDGPGYYYRPTVLTDVPPDTPAAREELFGPVAAVFPVASAEEALRVSNDTRFGLGAAAWVGSETQAEFFLKGIEAGSVFINGMVASDPRLPFGGIKSSGYGRELGSYGIREFVNVKTVWVGS